MREVVFGIFKYGGNNRAKA